ncbi:hypothetical protein BDZ89DRAFT_1053850 [Hymenopellis radicata]|nr:hypothetical protein BDZ89DRAFT_1053850 [Hymenopellis radicata]
MWESSHPTIRTRAYELIIAHAPLLAEKKIFRKQPTRWLHPHRSPPSAMTLYFHYRTAALHQHAHHLSPDPLSHSGALTDTDTSTAAVKRTRFTAGDIDLFHRNKPNENPQNFMRKFLATAHGHKDRDKDIEDATTEDLLMDEGSEPIVDTFSGAKLGAKVYTRQTNPFNSQHVEEVIAQITIGSEES